MHLNFQAYLQQQGWLQNQERVLVALSGGRDSMVLCHLLLESQLDFGLAHCNFQLRGAESAGDQGFVQQFAEKHELPFFTIDFDTEALSQTRKQSIQFVARDLRYEWLESIRHKEQYDYIATAHHLNDSLETLLFNLSKGTGIRGLHGIPPVNGHIIRPLLFATREQIDDYTHREKVAFREDSSNSSNKYHRNLIRQEVVPVLKQINPALEKTFGANISRFQEVEWLYEYALAQLKKELVVIHDNHWTIDLLGLMALPARVSILYEWLRPMHFHPDQIAQLFQPGKTLSGRLFFSISHELLADRDRLLLRPIVGREERHIPIRIDCHNVALPEGTLELDIFDQAPYTFPKDPTIAYFNFQALAFPLILRRWQAGDTFQPFGMQGHHQKLQDFFNNAKLSRFEKEQAWILESGGQICWVVGQRLDERFRVGDTDGQVMKVKWNPNIG